MALVYPPTGFHFIVRFEERILGEYPGIPDIGFQEVTGLTSEIGIEEYREGGENRFAHRLPNPASYSNISLKRGMLLGSSLMKWYTDTVESFKFTPYDMTIILLNGDHIPLQAWNIIKAIPIKWDISGLNASEAQVLVESVDFSYQYFRRIDPSSFLPF
ncbi:MAG: phage tail protein [Bacteroidota bacterium]